ncbi:TPA: hypothetical protein ACTXXA_003356 [Legionella anisa]
MNHKPIQFKDLSLIYPHKICFEFFRSEAYFGDCIPLIGRHGPGKSIFDHKVLESTHIETRYPLHHGTLHCFKNAHLEVIHHD